MFFYSNMFHFEGAKMPPMYPTKRSTLLLIGKKKKNSRRNSGLHSSSKFWAWTSNNDGGFLLPSSIQFSISSSSCSVIQNTLFVEKEKIVIMSIRSRLDAIVSSMVTVHPHEIPALLHSSSCFFFVSLHSSIFWNIWNQIQRPTSSF